MSPQPPPPSSPPPPTPPPPGRPGGDAWAGPDPAWSSGTDTSTWAAPSGGSPDGPPPPPWKRRRRRWGIAAAIVAAVLVIGVPVGFGLAALSSSAGDIRLTSPTPDGPTEPDGAEPREEVEVVVPDLDGLEGADAELGAVLVDVNRSEDQMLATQERFGEVFAGAGGPGSEDDIDTLLEEVSEAAGEGQRELQDIRRDLTATAVTDGEVRELRDRYLAHLDAWVRYFVAIESEPTLLAGGGDQAFTLAIDTTGDAFARSVRDGLPEDTDERVRTFAEQIVDRGFPERALSDDDTV